MRTTIKQNHVTAFGKKIIVHMALDAIFHMLFPPLRRNTSNFHPFSTTIEKLSGWAEKQEGNCLLVNNQTLSIDIFMRNIWIICNFLYIVIR
jgi:hypothetical protein